MDWGFVKVLCHDDRTYKLACFAMICHHCGFRYVEFFPNAKQENLFIGMIHAFSYMGIPEYVLTDNMKSVVKWRDSEGKPIWNGDYGIFMKAIGHLMDYIMEFKLRKSVEVLRKLSRIPTENPKTFSNFRFDDIRGKDVEKLKAITNMSAIHENRNLVFIGKHGVGKTHLAMAFGLECCNMGMKTYFTTLSELNDKFTQTRRWGTADKVLSNLVKPSCLWV